MPSSYDIGTLCLHGLTDSLYVSGNTPQFIMIAKIFDLCLSFLG